MATKRTSCGEATDAGKCKRLPAHKGEHRIGLTRKAARAAARKAAQPRVKRVVAAPQKRVKRVRANVADRPNLARPAVG